MKKILTFFFLFSMITANAQNENWAKLFGTTEEGKVKLYWELRDWPENLYGFVVKKRDIQENGQWINLNEEPISPTSEENKNWAIMGLNQPQIEELKSTFREYVQLGKIKNLPNQSYLAMLKQNGGPGPGDRIRMKEDYNIVLMSGFGYMDNSYDQSKTWEYGLFLVDINKNVEEQPYDILKIQNTDSGGSSQRKGRMSTELPVNPLLSLEMVRADKKITLMWDFSDFDEQETQGLFGFHVYKSTGKNIRKAERITKAAIGGFKKENGVTGTYVDTNVENNKNYTYWVRPVNLFQLELDGTAKTTQGTFTQQLKSEFENVKPFIKNIIIEGEKDVKLLWDPVGFRGFKGYVVELKNAGDETFVPVSKILSVNTINFIDSSPKKYGEVYTYRLALIDKKNNSYYSDIKNIYYLGMVKPPKVNSLKATVLKKDEKVFARLEWEQNTDNLTVGYKIYSDELKAGEILEINKIGIVKGGSCEFEIESIGGRVYQFEVAAMTEYGASSETTSAECFVGLLRWPEVRNLKVVRTTESKALITWDYNQKQTLQGFDIFVNNKLIKSHDEIGADVRQKEIEISFNEVNKKCAIQVRAVGKLGVSWKTLNKFIYEGNAYKKQLSQNSRREGLQVKLVKKKEGDFVELKWPDQKTDGLLGYAFYTDYEYEGRIWRLSNLPIIKETSYSYKLPEGSGNRKSFTFRIAPIDSNYKVGAYIQASLDLK